MSIIQSIDVKKWYGDFQALKGITMDVAEGEVLVICGPSGSGKSTFIRCINRLEQHQDGQIIVEEIDNNKTMYELYVANSADIDRKMILQKDATSPGLGSTDMGNISQVFPSIHPMLSIDAKNAVNHQPEYAAATITPGGHKAIYDGAYAMGFAKEVADRVMLFDEGQLVEENTPEEFFNNPKSDRTKLFLSQIL